MFLDVQRNSVANAAQCRVPMAGNTIGLFSGAARKQSDGFQPRLALSLFVLRLLPSYAFGGLRVRLLRFAGVRVGTGSGIGGSLWVAGGPDPASRLSIGDRCFVNDGCRFDTSAPITLEDDVHIGHDVAVLTATARDRRGRWAGRPQHRAADQDRARRVDRRPGDDPRRGHDRCRQHRRRRGRGRSLGRAEHARRWRAGSADQGAEPPSPSASLLRCPGMELGISGRRAAVAAASSGLGLGAARALHAEGARVAICGRDRSGSRTAAASIGRGAAPRSCATSATPPAARSSSPPPTRRSVASTSS